MSYSTTDFIGWGNVSSTLVENNSTKIVIRIEIQPHEVVCPCCGKKTSRVRDYRWQKIKSLPYGGKDVYLLLRKRRYVCQCGKRFSEEYDFLSRYHRMTRQVFANIKAFTNRFECILNSLDTPYTNGFVESKNNKIKVLKRNAYGVRNFTRFRKRILLSC